MYELTSRELADFLRESNFIEGDRDKFAKNRFDFSNGIIGKNDIDCAQFILHCEKIIPSNLKRAHKILCSGMGEKWGVPENEWVGKWKPIQNKVGNYIPPPPILIEGLMRNYCDNWGNMTPYEAHNNHMNIHPWLDYNGRMGRLLWLRKHLEKGTYAFEIGFLHKFYYESLSAQNTRKN